MFVCPFVRASRPYQLTDGDETWHVNSGYLGARDRLYIIPVFRQQKKIYSIRVPFSRLFKAKLAFGGGPRTDVGGFGRNLVGVVGVTWGDALWVKKVNLAFPRKKYF